MENLLHEVLQEEVLTVTDGDYQELRISIFSTLFTDDFKDIKIKRRGVLMKRKSSYHHSDWRVEQLLFSEIGRRIKEARVGKGLTQQELSDRIRLSRTSITNLENGVQKISLLTLYEICFVLDIEIHRLIPNNIKETS
ncbi:helix-turn-helix transcriptional regulator [Paenibacillus foliorum]|nr:helix-turn-helix transcriptional regulator [Paenibacillus foliorum]